VRPDIIFDHHMNSPIIDGCLNLIKKVGANSTIVYHLLKKIGAEFSHPSLIATALAVGIDTDTKSLAKVDEVTEFDLSAHRELLSLVDYALFKHLTERFEVTRGFFKCLKMALSENIDAIFVGSMAVLGVGEIKQSQIDYIPLIADMVLRTEQVRLVVGIGIVEGQFIKASVRTDLESIQIDQFCKEVFGADSEHVSTGARPGSGGAKVLFSASEQREWTCAMPEEKQVLLNIKLRCYRHRIEEILPDA